MNTTLDKKKSNRNPPISHYQLTGLVGEYAGLVGEYA